VEDPRAANFDLPAFTGHQHTAQEFEVMRNPGHTEAMHETYHPLQEMTLPPTAPDPRNRSTGRRTKDARNSEEDIKALASGNEEAAKENLARTQTLKQKHKPAKKDDALDERTKKVGKAPRAQAWSSSSGHTIEEARQRESSSGHFKEHGKPSVLRRTDKQDAPPARRTDRQDAPPAPKFGSGVRTLSAPAMTGKISTARFDNVHLASAFSSKGGSRFAEEYAKGVLPCRIDHGTCNHRIHWGASVDELRSRRDQLLALCADGLLKPSTLITPSHPWRLRT